MSQRWLKIFEIFPSILIQSPLIRLKRMCVFIITMYCCFSDEEEYEDLDYRTESQYWMADNQMKLVDDTYSEHESYEGTTKDHSSISPLAVKKLMR